MMKRKVMMMMTMMKKTMRATKKATSRNANDLVFTKELSKV